MESIHQAVERAKARSNQHISPSLHLPPQEGRISFSVAHDGERNQELQLDSSHLVSQRIVAFDGRDPRSRPFDILRTEVLLSMDLKGWKTVAVTSPTPGCGKTVTAANLALSMARQSDRQVCLVDLDLRKPQLAAALGLKRTEGVLDVIEGRVGLDSATSVVRIGGSRLDLLPTKPSSDPSDLVASSAMKSLLQDLAGHGRSRIVIIDLPPLLTGHDVISILPHVDCTLLVAAVGTSKSWEITDCNKYLHSTELLRVVLNKVPESARKYAYY